MNEKIKSSFRDYKINLTPTSSSNLQRNLIKINVPHADNYVINGCSNQVDEMDLSLKAEMLPIDDVAKEVINGEWGNGDERKKRLEEAGYNVAEVQGMVNEILTGVNTYVASEPIKETKDESLVEPLTDASSASNSMGSNRILNAKKSEIIIDEFSMKESNNSTDASSQIFVSNISESISNLVDKASEVASQVVSDENIRNISVAVDNTIKNNGLLADISQDDENGFLFWKEKTTLLDIDGSRIVYERRKELNDGAVEYYGKGDTLLKRINTDGTVVYYSTTGGADYYYNSEGEKIDFYSDMTENGDIVGRLLNYNAPHKFESDGRLGVDTANSISNNTVKYIIVSPDGTKKYYASNNSLILTEMLDGTYELYLINGDKEVHYSDGSYKQYSHSSNLGYFLYKDCRADGSYITYGYDGHISSIVLADGTEKHYFKEGRLISKTQRTDGTEISCWDDGTKRIRYPDGTEKRYSATEKLIFEKTIEGKEIGYHEDGTKIYIKYLDGTVILC